MTPLSTITERQPDPAVQSHDSTTTLLEQAKQRASIANQLTQWIERIETARAEVIEQSTNPSIQALAEHQIRELAVSGVAADVHSEQMTSVALHLTQWMERIETARASLRSESLSLFTLNREIEKRLSPLST
jgi:hypothetical protein